MIARLATGTVGVLCALALSGCAGAGDGSASSAPSPPPTESPHAPVLPDASATDADGRQSVGIGDAAVVLGDDGETIGSLTLLQVVRGFECDSSIDEPPVNDGFIGLQFEVTTPAEDHEDTARLRLSAHHLWGYDVEGVFIPDIVGTGYLCADDAIGPNFHVDETRTGWIVLDAPDEIAFVTYDADARHDIAWKWRIDS